ncbi:HNH endonuclease [Mycolicibacterium iranicum]|uniref:HNH endonuclease signature motif containing protein n=1 Tax=Mycolicibacterium iranicum TaxID=912594 RepID=A0ABT4HCP5_MYCIR|nr:HNH endonuclease signature motif containing protein [Mycolicibacterium iranicum]MCZ0727960.1 HNH endonuclease signature motif containing protein [Mycolicibacterium iranicum]
MKTCGRCGVAKLLVEFHQDRRRSDGRQSHCKACKKVGRAAYYAANRDAEAEQVRAYQQANREATNARKRKYHAANREAATARQRKYHAANPHVYWESRYRLRARRFGFDPVVESFTRADLVARYGDACFHCGGDFEELDHFPIPVSQGGPHALDNCRPSCTPCNQRSWKADAA